MKIIKKCIGKLSSLFLLILMSRVYTIRRGYIILLLTISILILSFSAAQVYFSAAFTEYQAASQQANYTKAKYLAQSGLEAALIYLNQLEKLGFFEETDRPYPVPLGEHIVQFQAEDLSGKFNLNQLVNLFNDGVNPRQLERLVRLSQYLKISTDIWDAVIDWIDKNNVPQPYGYEKTHYEALDPPRRIKNSAIASLEELLLIPGFTRSILFSDLRTEDEKEESAIFFEPIDGETNLVTDDDFILANNITYELPSNPLGNWNENVNINTAPYLVILSLHEEMTPEVVKTILVKRAELQAQGEKFDLAALKAIPGIPEDLVPEGGGTSLNAFSISDKSSLYKIRATAIIGSQAAQITATYDKRSNDIIDYSE